MSSSSTAWPAALRRYAERVPGKLYFRPERWAAGQLTLLIAGAVCVGIAIVSALTGENAPGTAIAFGCFGVALAAAPILDRARWVEIAPADRGWTVREGRWRWERRSVQVERQNVQTVLIVEDTRAYGFRIPLLRHVRVELVAAPFAGAPPAISIAEMFGLSDEVLTAFRALLETEPDAMSLVTAT